MRRSPRRPLILKRRKLPFQQNDLPAAESQNQSGPPASKEPSKSASSQCFPDGIRIMDHPSKSDTQVVVIPKTADLQSVIGALTAKGKECGEQGPNKFILLSGNGSRDSGGFCQPDGGPLDDSLTNIQWLGKMSTCTFEADPSKQMPLKENQNPPAQTFQVKAVQQAMAERPPYSYMAMIQFAINSRKSRRMTLKEIYMWIEEHFPYYRDVAKPGWKNSIRHNLSLHKMFIRETSPDGKVSFWTIRPEANRCLTLDQVYKVSTFTLFTSLMIPDAKKAPTGSERKMKPLLPRTDSYFVPIQLPVTSSVYLPSSSIPFPLTGSKQKRNTSRETKRVRIAPKVTQSDAQALVMSPLKNLKVEVKEEQICVPIKCETPKSTPKRQASCSRRKQCLVRSLHEEPILCPDNTFFDSGVASDVSTFQDIYTELDEHHYRQDSPDREFSFKTPIKSSSHISSSTPSKPPSNVLEPWKVTPVGKGSQSVLDFSPIRTPGGPAVTPRHDYTTFSFNSTPFKDWPLFSSPRELLTSAPSRATGPTESPIGGRPSSCSGELLQAGGSTAANHSLTEGLVLDTMNDSLSKILVDISFSALDDEDFGMANISWSEFIPQFK
uniref:Forkhead box protein M1 n=1 Tax=Amphiprion percula TaxID=161767 RepID=A0A3P8U1W9_AMPPE